HLLVRRGNCAARDFSLRTSLIEPPAVHEHLHLAPVEQTLEVGQEGDREWYSRHRTLGGVDLQQDDAHARLGRREHARLLLDGALLFGKYLLSVVEDSLALPECDDDPGVRPPRHRS